MADVGEGRTNGHLSSKQHGGGVGQPELKCPVVAGEHQDQTAIRGDSYSSSVPMLSDPLWQPCNWLGFDSYYALNRAILRRLLS